jgi:hypothetical protein
MVLREVLAGGRRLRPEHLPNFFGVLTTLKFIIEKGVAEGVFRPLDPVTTFLIVNGGLIFFLSTEPFRQRILGSVPGAPQFPETDRFIEAMEQFVRRGLAPEARDSNNVKRSRR